MTLVKGLIKNNCAGREETEKEYYINDFGDWWRHEWINNFLTVKIWEFSQFHILGIGTWEHQFWQCNICPNWSWKNYFRFFGWALMKIVEYRVQTKIAEWWHSNRLRESIVGEKVGCTSIHFGILKMACMM